MPRPPSGNIRISTHLEPRQVQALDLLAQKDKVKKSVLIRSAIDMYVRYRVRTMTHPSKTL